MWEALGDEYVLTRQHPKTLRETSSGHGRGINYTGQRLFCVPESVCICMCMNKSCVQLSRKETDLGK